MNHSLSANHLVQISTLWHASTLYLININMYLKLFSCRCQHYHFKGHILQCRQLFFIFSLLVPAGHAKKLLLNLMIENRQSGLHLVVSRCITAQSINIPLIMAIFRTHLHGSFHRHKLTQCMIIYFHVWSDNSTKHMTDTLYAFILFMSGEPSLCFVFASSYAEGFVPVASREFHSGREESVDNTAIVALSITCSVIAVSSSYNLKNIARVDWQAFFAKSSCNKMHTVTLQV